MTKYWLSLISIFLSLSTSAQEQGAQDKTEQEVKKPSPWKAEAEFGYRELAGNTDSLSLNYRLYGEYTKGKYRTSADWAFYRYTKNGSESKRRSSYSFQNDIKLSPKTYYYTNYSGMDTKYTAYQKDHTVSAGLGYQLIYTDKVTLEAELGPGYRYQKPNQDEIDSNDIVFPETVQEPIIRGNLKSSWKIIDDLKFIADLTTVSGNSNTLITSDVGITTSVINNIALKVNYSYQYHTRVPSGLDKRDTVTTFNLLFSFQ